ncbi:hypothetical protein ACQCVK_15460 [Rossellomorea vietnamensis]|uniref:hypothetical protein n=1 Tax=Rossellomorea vietnamensis TaxID=218284 RepID=UPI003CE7DEAE
MAAGFIGGFVGFIGGSYVFISENSVFIGATWTFIGETTLTGTSTFKDESYPFSAEAPLVWGCRDELACGVTSVFQRDW